MDEWSIRTLLNPVITRLLIYGINPVDLEYVLTSLESVKLLNAKKLESEWLNQWEIKAAKFISIAENAEKNNSKITAHELYFFAAQCYYACFLINFADVNEKIRVYLKFAEYYKKSIDLSSSDIQKIEIPLADNRMVSAYLHIPADMSDCKNIISIFSGIGSCKEEMHHLAEAFTARGLAVIVPDMPGNGETVITHGVKGRMKDIELTFDAVINFIHQSQFKECTIGVCGLCMGAGYAFRAAVLRKEFSFCINLFPLFISEVNPDTTPQWMKSGAWFEKQVGQVEINSYLQEMGLQKTDYIDCPYFVAYGKYDNWMLESDTLNLIERVRNSDRKIIVVEEKPVFSGQSTFTHTMPVGEQLHWIRHIMADWAVSQFKNTGI